MAFFWNEPTKQFLTCEKTTGNLWGFINNLWLLLRSSKISTTITRDANIRVASEVPSLPSVNVDSHCDRSAAALNESTSSSDMDFNKDPTDASCNPGTHKLFNPFMRVWSTVVICPIFFSFGLANAPTIGPYNTTRITPSSDGISIPEVLYTVFTYLVGVAAALANLNLYRNGA